MTEHPRESDVDKIEHAIQGFRDLGEQMRSEKSLAIGRARAVLEEADKIQRDRSTELGGPAVRSVLTLLTVASQELLAAVERTAWG